ATHAGTTDGDDADLLLRSIAKLRSQRSAVSERRWVEACHVTWKAVVAFGPGSDLGQTGAEAIRHDVRRLAHEQRAVANARKALDLLDHLRVVVGRERSLVGTSVGHRQPADEIREPNVGRSLLFGVLVQE